MNRLAALDGKEESTPSPSSRVVNPNLGVGVQVIKRSRSDTRRRNEGIDFVLAQSDHPAEFVCGDGTLVDELVKGSQRNPEAFGGLIRAQPMLFRSHEIHRTH